MFVAEGRKGVRDAGYDDETIKGAAEAAAAHENNGSQGPPPPHQFLLRGATGKGKAPRAKRGAPAIKNLRPAKKRRVDDRAAS